MPPRKTNEKRRDVAKEKLTGLVEAWDAAEDVVVAKRHKAYAGMLKAFNAGLTYAEIAEISGLSHIRVSQILAEQRNGA